MKSKIALLAGLVVALAAAGPVAGAFHFALSKSVPAADSTVPSPEEVRLWFTQEPQENSVSIRVIDGAGDALATSEPTRDAADRKIMSVSVDRRLPAGAYTVAWRGIGDDGHVVRGDFGFTVSAQ